VLESSNWPDVEILAVHRLSGPALKACGKPLVSSVVIESATEADTAIRIALSMLGISDAKAKKVTESKIIL
jgi:hypothetical protein